MAAALAVTADCSEEQRPPAAGAPLAGTVERVSDGDTIVVRLESGARERVRYIGIDTPELAEHECFAERAADFNARLVAGRRVRLVRDAEERDRYGRLLAYVHVGEAFVNAELIRKGYAQPLTVPPNVRHAERFRRLAGQARRARAGLWSACAS